MSRTAFAGGILPGFSETNGKDLPLRASGELVEEMIEEDACEGLSTLGTSLPPPDPTTAVNKRFYNTGCSECLGIP